MRTDDLWLLGPRSLITFTASSGQCSTKCFSALLFYYFPNRSWVHNAPPHVIQIVTTIQEFSHKNINWLILTVLLSAYEANAAWTIDGWIYQMMLINY